MAPPTLRLAQDPEADALLARDPLALLMGMLLDQQFPLEWAFRAPWRLAQRMERTSLDAAELAGWDPDAFVKLMAGPPALHRYPASMAVRVQALCRIVVDTYGGDASAIWRTASSGKELFTRLRALPGFGEQKARIFVPCSASSSASSLTAGGRWPGPTARTGRAGRPPTSPTPRPWPRSAPSSSRPSRPPRAARAAASGRPGRQGPGRDPADPARPGPDLRRRGRPVRERRHRPRRRPDPPPPRRGHRRPLVAGPARRRHPAAPPPGPPAHPPPRRGHPPRPLRGCRRPPRRPLGGLGPRPGRPALAVRLTSAVSRGRCGGPGRRP